MKKKMIALLLASTLIATGITPAYAAEFSDGGEFVEAQEPAFGTSPEDFTFTDEEAVPVMEETVPVEAATAIGQKYYTVNFDCDLILSQTQEFVRLLNIEREKLGVAPVQIDQQMMEKAIKRVPEVWALYDHVDPETGEETNRTYYPSAECLEISFGYEPSAISHLGGFETSPKHWEILMDSRYTRIGAAIGRDMDKYGDPYGACTINVQLGSSSYGYTPYTGDFKDKRKNYTQKINKEFFGGLAGEEPGDAVRYVGRKSKLFPGYDGPGRSGGWFNYMEGGCWKSLNPDIVSVDQQGNVTMLSPGFGSVMYYLKDEPEIFYKRNFEVLALEEDAPSHPGWFKPTTPKVKNSVLGNVNVKLTWNKTMDTTGYQIFKYNGKSKKYVKIKTLKNASSTSFTHKIGYGKTAKYKIRGYNKTPGGTVFYGDFSKVQTVKTATAAPVLTKVSNANGRIKLRWNYTAGAEGYQIYCKTDKSNQFKRIKTINNGKVLGFTTGKLKKGTTYSYKIRTYRKGTNGKNIYSKWSKVAVKTCK